MAHLSIFVRSDLSMIFLVSASTVFAGVARVFFSFVVIVFLFVCFICRFPTSSLLPYDFVGKKEPAIVNLSSLMYILGSMKPTSTMIIFTKLETLAE